jgi:thiol-disulfide isomerase/thioredoxin
MMIRYWAVITTIAMGFAAFTGESVRADEVAAEEVLSIGSTAPDLEIEHWVSDGKGQFEKTEKLQKDKVYVVEFWATWCGPCIASMPHLAELQEKYLDQGVQIISVSDEDLETVNSFLDREVQDSEQEGQTYRDLTSVYCLTADPDRSVHTAYMEAAQQNGIPTAFIVGKDGVIEWIGHPMAMDETLEQVLAGKWDREAAKEQIRREQMRNLVLAKVVAALDDEGTDKAMELLDAAAKEYADDAEFVAYLQMFRSRIPAFAVMKKFQTGDVDAAMEMLEQLAEQPDHDKQIVMQLQTVALAQLVNGANYERAAPLLDKLVESPDMDPMTLNQLAWSIYQAAAQGNEIPEPLVTSATNAAQKAAKEAPEDGGILDTYARLLHQQGKLDEALEVQTRAAKTPGDHEDAINEFLEQLKKEKSGSSE